MRKVSERSLLARAKRQVLKNEGLILHKHKKGNKDYYLNGNLYSYAVDPDANLVKWYLDKTDFIAYCKKNNVLKIDEELEEK